jgi:hypothetical protein
MSVTFWVSNSPRKTITREEGTVEQYDETIDVLPTCNFANGNAAQLLSMINVDIDSLGWAGTWPHAILEDKVEDLRTLAYEFKSKRDLHPHHFFRVMALHTVVHAAMQCGEDVCFG